MDKKKAAIPSTTGQCGEDSDEGNGSATVNNSDAGQLIPRTLQDHVRAATGLRVERLDPDEGSVATPQQFNPLHKLSSIRALRREIDRRDEQARLTMPYGFERDLIPIEFAPLLPVPVAEGRCNRTLIIFAGDDVLRLTNSGCRLAQAWQGWEDWDYHYNEVSRKGRRQFRKRLMTTLDPTVRKHLKRALRLERQMDQWVEGYREELPREIRRAWNHLVPLPAPDTTATEVR